MTWRKWGTYAKTATKVVTYRLMNTTVTFLVTWMMTGKMAVAAGVAGFEVMVKPALYFLHDRAWETKALVKVFETEVN